MVDVTEPSSPRIGFGIFNPVIPFSRSFSIFGEGDCEY